MIIEDKLYAFVMRGELAKTSLQSTDIVPKYTSSEVIAKEYAKSLSLDLLDDECTEAAKLMATVYTAIATFENMVRQFVVKILMEHAGESWWEKCVPEKIRKNAGGRKADEEKLMKKRLNGIEIVAIQ